MHVDTKGTAGRGKESARKGTTSSAPNESKDFPTKAQSADVKVLKK